MFLRGVFFALCLPLFLMGAAIDQNIHTKGAIPSWVKPLEVPLDEVSVKPSQVNLQYLLIDTQRNWEEKSLYCHFAVKTLTQSGVENISRLTINFDPSYTQIVMHDIRVFRDGKWLDRLENTRYNLVQRETDLEKNLYNGDLALIYFLDDIRKGDLVEYSYSINGSHPFFSSHYAERIYLQGDSSVEKITHRFLGNPDLSFLIKPTNIELEPKVADLNPSLREWVWEISNTEPYLYEAGQPIWYNPPAQIEMSQYQTWEEVAQKIYPLYVLPSDFTQSIPLEMQILVEQWKTSTSDVSKRALLALRFVQDQIRYLGFEEDMGAFQPTDPRLVFQRRFGDCKDKSFLLHALLQLMDIPSKPLLVHSVRGKQLAEILPTPFAFDHLVLQLEIDGSIYYVDPTFTLQGGSLQTNFFPSYGYGLLLSNNSKGLISLPEAVFKHPVEFEMICTLESENLAHLTMKTIFHGPQADEWRRPLEWSGLKSLEESCLSEMREIYGAVTSDGPLEALDDREGNTLTFVESYHLPTKELDDTKVIELFSHTLKHYLHGRIDPERKSPCAISYPLWIKERIHIENPFNRWEPLEEDYTQKHESIFYSLSTQIKEKSATFVFELNHLQDHIPQTSLREYWALINDINRKAPLTMNITSPTPLKKGMHPALFYLIIGVVAGVVLYFLLRKDRSTQSNLFSKEENSLRKHWLWAHAWNSVLLCLGFACVLMGTGQSEIATFGLLGLALNLVMFWLGYHCAYKKHGIRLLTFWLTASAIFRLQSWTKGANEGLEGVFLWFTAMEIVIFVWWFCVAFQLRKINKKILQKKIELGAT